ncbi:MAG: hypothetical protein QG665_21 [Patescibacteria group bacterium]|nr:hypothetical protein [Patescibacteria group bacterium]
MSWRNRRRVAIVLTVLLVFAVVAGFYFYFTKPLPSCLDGKQNQGEWGVDCGGPCARVCRSETQPLVTLWTRVFEITPGNYTAVAYVENPNRLLGLPTFNYEFVLTDFKGTEIARASGESFANPKERFIVFSSNIMAPAGTANRSFLGFPDNFVWQRLDKDPLKIQMKRKNFSLEPSPNLSAEVLSEEIKTINRFPVYVVLSDKNGNAISASATFVDSLGAQSATDVYFTWPTPFADTPVFFDFYPHASLFD